MSSLFGSLQIGQQALQAQQFGLTITQKNIGNINTPGYSREQANLVPGDPTGVSGVSVESFRNRFLDYSINQQLQGQGEQGSVTATLQQVEALMNQQGGPDLQTAMSDFFNSFSSLANSPEDITLRQQVLAKAGALAGGVNHLYGQIQAVQTSIDGQVADTVQAINSITSSIAGLNATIARNHGSQSQEKASAQDQRQQLLDQLSGLVDFSYFQTETGSMTLMTKQGALLVVGDQSHQMQAAPLAGNSFLQVQIDGQNITSQLQSGKLGGLLKARDTLIPGYLQSLDDLAAGLTDRVNIVHATGKDLNGAAGGDLFVPFTQTVPGSNTGAARAMAVAISDPTKVAAAGPTSGSGSNANALALAGIQSELQFSAGSQTATQVYASLISTVGTDLRSALDEQTTQDQVLTQLQNQRDAYSGVNMDEEATNIIRYQKAYEASARFINIVSTLTDQLIQILG